MTRITIRDIAKAAGVSPGAVSLALNNKPGVASHTRENIQKIAEELGWVPNPAARALSSKQANNVGLCITRSDASLKEDTFFFPFICGLSYALSKADIATTIRLSPTRDNEMAVYKEWASARQVDAVVLVDLDDENERPRLLDSLGLSFAAVGGSTHAPIHIQTNDRASMHLILDHLWGQGFQKPAYIAGLNSTEHTRARIHAFLDKCNTLGFEDPVILNADYTYDAGAASARTILEQHKSTDAIICDNDTLTAGCISYLAMSGRKIPQDIGIFSWEDSTFCKVYGTGISALSRDPEDLGKETGKALVKHLQTGENIIVNYPPGEIIARGSTQRIFR